MATIVRIRCVACGVARPTKHFGITPDGEFEPSAQPQHVIELVLTTLSRSGITCEKTPMPLPFARALRKALRSALARLEREIEAAGGSAEDAA